MWGAILGGVAAGGVSGLIGASGAKRAAKAQEEAAKRAIGEERRQFDTSRRDMAPWMRAGGAAQDRLAHLLGLGDPLYGGIRKPTMEDAAFEVLEEHRKRFEGRGYTEDSDMAAVAAQEKAVFDRMMREYEAKTAGIDKSVIPEDYGSLNRRFTIEDFEEDPVNQLTYQFGLDEGTKAIRRMLGASGMARSGAAVKGLTRFASDYAGSKAGESRNRFIQDQDITFNRLSGVSGSGQTATQNTAALGANTATRIGQHLTGAANARGAAAIAGANAIAAPVAQAGNLITTKFLLDSMRTPPINPTPQFGMDDLYTFNS